MTTDKRFLVALAALALVACVTGRSTLRGGLPEERVAKYPPNVQEAYRLFAARCSRCHTLSRPLNAQIDDFSHWVAYVERMRHHAGSGISKADGEKILVFLKHYLEEENPSQRTTPDSAGGASGSEAAP